MTNEKCNLLFLLPILSQNNPIQCITSNITFYCLLLLITISLKYIF